LGNEENVNTGVGENLTGIPVLQGGTSKVSIKEGRKLGAFGVGAGGGSLEGIVKKTHGLLRLK